MNELMLCLCLSFGTGPNRPADRFFAEDKLKHFAVSFAFTSLASSGARATGIGRGPSLALGATAGMAIGVGKELRDLRASRARAAAGDTTAEGSTASMLDLAWDALGVGAATILVAQSR
jgi:hypothetical protein